MDNTQGGQQTGRRL